MSVTEKEIEFRPQSRSRIPLIQGTNMVCPRCRTPRNILDFQRFGEVEEFASDTAPIYKCPKTKGGCGWIFAPAEHTIHIAMKPASQADGEVRYE